MDLQLISGNFLTSGIPKEKIYLKYYFTGVSERFIVYCCTFPELLSKSSVIIHRCFTEHTGLRYSLRSVAYNLSRYLKLEKKIKQASEQYNLDLLYKIKNGQISPKDI